MKNSIPINYPEYDYTESFHSLKEPMLAYMPATFLKSNVLDNLTQNSKDLFVSLVKNTGLTIKMLAENIFEITPKTFIKYKNNETKIPSRITEIAIEINTLYALGNEVFGTSNNFNNWLETNNQFFNNCKPAGFLNTSTGIHYIFEEVKRIEFGATA